MSTQKEFLFLECEGATGRSASSKRHLKNRHAQLGQLSNRSSEGVSEAAPHAATLPVQIKFKAAEQSQGVESYFGRCGRCRKRRKLAHWTGRCTQCDKNAPLPLSENTSVQTSELVEYDNRQSPVWVWQDYTAPSTITCDISCGMRACPADRKAMQYFLNFACLDLSGYLPGRFWDGFVLQACQSEPMVRQAVLAVSNAHLDHCHRGSISTISLASYQATINKLRTYMNRADPRPELVLLCCIMMFTFDQLRGDRSAAAMHLRSAMAILTNAMRSKTCENRTRLLGTNKDAINDLRVKLVQMDIEDTMPQLDRGSMLDVPDMLAKEPSPMKFFSPHDFVEPWMDICHGVWAFTGRNVRYRRTPIADVPKDVVAERNRLQRWIRTWRTAHRDYIQQAEIPTASDLPGAPPSQDVDRRIINAINALIIESHYYVIKSVLAECLLGISPTRLWDRVAEKLLQCGEKALSLRQAYREMHSLPARKTFSTHVGIVESLLTLSHRTASPDVRGRAQALIRGFRDVSGNLTGVSAFFAGYGAPPSDLILIYEKPGH